MLLGAGPGKEEVTTAEPGGDAAPTQSSRGSQGRAGGTWVWYSLPRIQGRLRGRKVQKEGPHGLSDPPAWDSHRASNAPPSLSADWLGPFSRDFCFLSLRRWQRWWWWVAAWLAAARSRPPLQSCAAWGRCGASVEIERFMGLVSGAGCGRDVDRMA